VRVDTVRGLAILVRERRQELARTQTEVAAAASVSRRWLTAFESGKPTAEIGLVLRTLHALNLTVDIRPTEMIVEKSGLPHVDLDAVLRDYLSDTDV
jgi:HTH-type transcriptional regulator / antitoxin HipB